MKNFQCLLSLTFISLKRIIYILGLLLLTIKFLTRCIPAILRNRVDWESVTYLNGFSNPATPAMEAIVDFHHDVFTFLIFIFCIVSWFLLRILLQFRGDYVLLNKKPFNIILEVLWTIIPTIILYYIAVPSLSLLYCLNEMYEPLLTVKMVGNQWYWHYELDDNTV